MSKLHFDKIDFHCNSIYKCTNTKCLGYCFKVKPIFQANGKSVLRSVVNSFKLDTPQYIRSTASEHLTEQVITVNQQYGIQ